MSTTPRRQAPAGLTVDGYTLLARIGEGGMGVVHLAQQPGGDRVALKVLRPHIVGDDEARARLAREVNSLSRIRSPRIAEIVDADPWGPVPFVATRYVPGLSLHDYVREHGPIAGADLSWFAACLAEALAAVHACGVLHRDIKPANVLMEGRSPVLIDFGLARVADDPKLTHTGWLLGTPGYLAPEILYGEDASTASDIHSWAATVAFAGTGRPPFGRGPSMAVMDRVRRGEHHLDGLTASLRELVTDALDPYPSRRPTLPAIRSFLAGPSPVVAATPVPPPNDPFTMPLAVAALANADTTTDRFLPPTLAQTEHGRPESALESALESPPPVPAPPVAERLRRGALAAAGVAAAGATVAAYPYLATAALVLIAWLLRSGSLAATAAGDRRRLRGLKWYDGPQLLLAAPWHLVQSLPATFMLVLWSGGLSFAGALLGYAANLPLPGTLLVAGVLLAGALCWGPGGSRVRRPLGRGLNAAAARPLPWVVVMTLAVALATGAEALATEVGVDWAPAQEGPLARR